MPVCSCLWAFLGFRKLRKNAGISVCIICLTVKPPAGSSSEVEQFRWQEEAKMLVRNEDILKATLRSRCVWYFGWNGKPDENLRLKPIFQLRSVSLDSSSFCVYCEILRDVQSNSFIRCDLDHFDFRRAACAT